MAVSNQQLLGILKSGANYDSWLQRLITLFLDQSNANPIRLDQTIGQMIEVADLKGGLMKKRMTGFLGHLAASDESGAAVLEQTGAVSKSMAVKKRLFGALQRHYKKTLAPTAQATKLSALKTSIFQSSVPAADIVQNNASKWWFAKPTSTGPGALAGAATPTVSGLTQKGTQALPGMAAKQNLVNYETGQTVVGNVPQTVAPVGSTVPTTPAGKAAAATGVKGKAAAAKNKLLGSVSPARAWAGTGGFIAYDAMMKRLQYNKEARQIDFQQEMLPAQYAGYDPEVEAGMMFMQAMGMMPPEGASAYPVPSMSSGGVSPELLRRIMGGNQEEEVEGEAIIGG